MDRKTACRVRILINIQEICTQEHSTGIGRGRSRIAGTNFKLALKEERHYPDTKRKDTVTDIVKASYLQATLNINLGT